MNLACRSLRINTSIGKIRTMAKTPKVVAPKAGENPGRIIDIDVASEALNTAWAAASEDMYKATQGGEQGAPTGEAADAGAADEVTDVDFEEVKDEEKK